MDRKIFVAGLDALTACVNDLKVDDAKINIWFKILKEIPDKTYLDAMLRLCQEDANIYPGTNIPALIIEKVKELSNDVPCAAEAWHEVRTKIKKTSHSKIPEWSNPAIAKTVEAVGWESVYWTIQRNFEETFVRGQFLKLYGQFEGIAKKEQFALGDNTLVKELAENLSIDKE